MSVQSREERPDLTVAICSLNRREQLEETLATLREQRTDGTWEVLAIDNGSTDGTPEVAAAMGKALPVPFRLEIEPRRGLSFARNAALQSARGDAVLFLDDDVNCLPGLVDGHLQALREPDVVATAGRIVPLMPPDTPRWFLDLVSKEVGGPTSRYDFGDDGGEIPVSKGQPHPVGANMGIRRSLALECGGFRTDLGWGEKLIPCEETEFFQRASKRPGRFLYLPQATVEHRIAANHVTWSYYRRWQRGFGRATALIDAPDGFPRRQLEICRSLLLLLRYSWSAVRSLPRGRTRRWRKAIRKRERATGRLLQLLHL